MVGEGGVRPHMHPFDALTQILGEKDRRTQIAGEVQGGGNVKLHGNAGDRGIADEADHRVAGVRPGAFHNVLRNAPGGGFERADSDGEFHEIGDTVVRRGVERTALVGGQGGERRPGGEGVSTTSATG